jgi:hypothetical protein
MPAPWWSWQGLKQFPELCIKSERGTKLGKFNVVKQFGGDVGRVFVSGYVGHSGLSLFDFLMCPVVGMVDMSRPLIKY